MTTNWQQRFLLESVLDVNVAVRRRARAVFVGSAGGPRQVHSWDRDTGAIVQLTSAPKGVLTATIDAEGKYAYFMDDPSGGEEGWFARVPFSGGELERYDGAGPPSWILASTSGAGLVAWTSAEDDGYVHRIALVGDAPGSVAGTIVAASDGFAYVGAITADGQAVAIMAEPEPNRLEIRLIDHATGVERARLATPGGSCVTYAASPIPGDTRFLVDQDIDGRRRPLLWSSETGVLESLPVGDLTGDIRPLDWSPDGRHILFVQLVSATTTLHVADLERGSVVPLSLPTGAVTALPFAFAAAFGSEDDVIAIWQSGANPPALLSIPIAGHTPAVVVGAVDVPSGHEWASVAFASGDGTPIQGWLALPDGQGPFPTIVHVHGGPHIVQGDVFDPMLQALVDAGFAVIAPNYRGSGGFGNAFRESIFGRGGELELDDVAAARRYVLERGIATTEALIVEGWSYGGYLALLALGRQPDLWTAGIAGIAVGDLAACYAEESEVLRSADREIWGGSPAEFPDRYSAASPITWAPAVRAPVLIIQGRNDIRCPAGQMERYIARAEELGKDVEVEWFEGGHMTWATDAGVGLANTARMLHFACRVVDRGRTDP